jgi:hypothetical protein
LLADSVDRLAEPPLSSEQRLGVFDADLKELGGALRGNLRDLFPRQSRKLVEGRFSGGLGGSQAGGNSRSGLYAGNARDGQHREHRYR